MELNKEELYEVVDTIKNFACLCYNRYDPPFNERVANKELLNECSEKMEQLIKEHFELKEKYEKYVKRFAEYEIEMQDLQDLLLKKSLNKPLKFEDLQTNMWIWDNKAKRYLIIYDTIIINYNERQIRTYYSGYTSLITFEENRFYPREVKENGF